MKKKTPRATRMVSTDDLFLHAAVAYLANNRQYIKEPDMVAVHNGDEYKIYSRYDLPENMKEHSSIVRQNTSYVMFLLYPGQHSIIETPSVNMEEARELAVETREFWKMHGMMKVLSGSASPFVEEMYKFSTEDYHPHYAPGLASKACGSFKWAESAKQREDKYDRIARAANEYLAGVGEKINVSVTVTRYKRVDTRNYTGFAYQGITECNHMVAWWSTNPVFCQDQTVNITGTVKKHGTLYNSEKAETFLTRVKEV